MRNFVITIKAVQFRDTSPFYGSQMWPKDVLHCEYLWKFRDLRSLEARIVTSAPSKSRSKPSMIKMRHCTLLHERKQINEIGFRVSPFWFDFIPFPLSSSKPRLRGRFSRSNNHGETPDLGQRSQRRSDLRCPRLRPLSRQSPGRHQIRHSLFFAYSLDFCMSGYCSDWTVCSGQ